MRVMLPTTGSSGVSVSESRHAVANQIAESLGPVRVALVCDEAIEMREENGVDGDADASKGACSFSKGSSVARL
jgi:hypothetical protein